MSYETAQNPQDPSSYFVPEDQEFKEIERKQRINTVLSVLKYYAIKIWPFVQKIIETVVYFLITLSRSIVKIAFNQIKNFKGGE